MIEFKNVNFKYECDKVVDNVSFKIKKGEFVGIIGHTGSGKSTLIQMMNGLLKPESGKVLCEGEEIFSDGYDLRKLKFKIGLVFQYPEHQLFESSVIKDVMYGAINKGFNEEEARSCAKEALSTVGIEENKYDNSPFELSGGEKKRVAIAGILAMKPDVIILDEPAAGLDPITRKNIFNMLNDLCNSENKTVVVVSHSMEDMAEYADHIIVMNDGRCEMDGTAYEVFNRIDELENIGLAAPEVTYLMRELKNRGIYVDETIIKMEEALKCLETLL